MPRRQRLVDRREQLGLSQADVAARAGLTDNTIRRYELGLSSPRGGDRRAYAGALEWSPAQLSNAFNDTEAPLNGQAVPTWLTLHAALEQSASRIWAFQPFTVHALLQTPDYATAVERADVVPKSETGIARRVEIRMARQAVLNRGDPLALQVILDESVLYRTTGGTAIMAEQLEHLADVSTLVELRILPLGAGRHSAAFGGFTVIATEGQTDPQIVCVEDRTGIRYLERPYEVEPHMAVFDHLWGYSLPADESVDLIRRIAKEIVQ